ncbi:MAG: helix-turn-helix domain-containing protein [Nitrospiraceae bacterium]
MHRSWPITIVLVSSDADLQAQVKQTFKAATLTVVKDQAQVSRSLDKQSADVVLIESKQRDGRDGLDMTLDDLGADHEALVITGSRRALRHGLTLVQNLADPKPAAKPTPSSVLSLEDLIQSKVTDFVKGMRNGSARNLYPILLSAVERPLLSSTLKETQGNQIQAARLLGMNRNTLRKKLTALHIPRTRTKSEQKAVQ